MEIGLDSSNWISQLKNRYIAIWEQTPDTFPQKLQCFSDVQRQEREVRMQSSTDEMVRLIKSFSGNEDPQKWGTSLKHVIRNCGVNVVDLTADSMELLLEGGFCESTSDFISTAHEFDTAIKMDDIMQALRNVWIMNCIQDLMETGIRNTSSVFAYSMLYPYTDNFLDASSESQVKKERLNSRLGRRLAGELPKPESTLENKLYKLVEMIEGEFQRSKYPMVYQGLLAIQRGQEKSLLQHKKSAPGITGDKTAEILGISFEKGGSSVLADACLVKGSLTAEEAFFMFGFGILLQLLDDLQDISADRGSGHTTLFSAQNPGNSPESSTNRLINFILNVLDQDHCFSSPSAVKLKEMMKKSILFLLLGAVACNSGMYGKHYLIRLEEFSPMSFKYLKSFYKKISREYGKLKLKFALMPLEVPMAKAFAAGRI